MTIALVSDCGRARQDTQAPHSGYDPWRDAHGTPIPHQCRIEQIVVDKSHGALPSRLYQQGQVLGCGTTRLSVRCDDETTVVGIRPHLVGVLTTQNDHPPRSGGGGCG